MDTQIGTNQHSVTSKKGFQENGVKRKSEDLTS